MSLRKRIAASKWVNELAAAIVYRYVRLCHATTRWEREGFDEMYAALREGRPVITVLWHERLFMSMYLFDPELCKICAITTNSRVSYLGQRILSRFDFESVMIEPNDSPVALTREILGRIRNGYSVAISPDGTRGPPRVAKPFPIIWARSARIPIFCVAYSVRRALRLPTWDRALIPLPFNRGAMLVRRWPEEVPRGITDAQTEDLRAKIETAVNDLTDDADRRVGRAVDNSWRSNRS